MIDALFQINWLAVLAATVAHTVFGAVWFTALFGKHYALALGIAEKPTQKPAPMFILGPIICSTIIIITTAFLIQALGIITYSDALVLGLIIGVGYLGTMTVNIAINPLFPKPFRYALVNAPMFIIGSIMSAAILITIT